MSVRKILIAGGTHGNELTGVRLANEWLENPDPLFRDGLETKVVLANPEAVRQCRRYIDTDLNRCFSRKLLDQLHTNSVVPSIYEYRLAKELDTTFGPKGSSQAPDLCLDLHNTTSAMGISLILGSRSDMLTALCGQVAQWWKGANPWNIPLYLFVQPETQQHSPYLPTIANLDLTIEVGPQCHGTLCADLLESTRSVVFKILDLLQERNAGAQWNSTEVEVFTLSENLDYHRTPEGVLDSMIHPSLQGADYQPLRPGAPVFRTFAGVDIPWDGPHIVYPVFINEAAYYEKNLALSLTTRSIEIW